MKLTVTESVLRSFLRNLMVESAPGGDVYEPKFDATKVSAQVDSTEPVTNPSDPDYVPQNQVELDVAIKNLVKRLPSEKIPSIYKAAKKAVDDENKETSDADERFVGDTKDTGDTEMDSKKVKKQVEAALRSEIRKMIKEIFPSADYSYSGPDTYADAYSDEEEEELEREPKRKFSTMSDVDGSTFEEIAAELGFSIAGAKQAVDKALTKARFVGSQVEEDPDDLELTVLIAMNDYVKMLEKSGELTQDDVQLMKDNPDIVRELDGFRDFLHKYIKRDMKKSSANEGKTAK